MSKIATEFPIAGLALEKNIATPLHIQLYEHIRRDILQGRLRPGQKLPASRSLAASLHVSRNTVTLAFDQLMIEGYLQGRTGSGTFVADQIPEELLHSSATPISLKPLTRQKLNKVLPQYGLNENLLGRNKSHESIAPFQTATPAFEAFPYRVWASLASKVYRDMSHLPLSYNEAAGYYPLREAIAEYLRIARAVQCEADNILITTGSQQGLNMVAEVLMHSGEEMWIEDPGYHGARTAFMKAGAKLCPVPVGTQGINIDYGIQHFPHAKLVYLTPSHQYPLGGTLPLSERLKLLQWAYRKKVWILEDDYDSELRYNGRPVASLYGLDEGKRVLYLGTFSKVLYPALRIGYLVLPTPELFDLFTSAKAMMDRQNSIIEQVILAEFIRGGHFARHIRRMRVLYQEKQKNLLDASSQYLSDLLMLEPSDAGMHLVGWLPAPVSDQLASQYAAKWDVIAHPISDYTIQHKVRSGLLLGYTSSSESEIQQGVRRLATALQSLLDHLSGKSNTPK